jgi:hypothetical protein
MNVKAVRLIMTLAAALVMAANPSFGGSWHSGKSSAKSVTVTLGRDAKLNNGTMLKAGDYTVRIPENSQAPEVEFYANGRLVAKAQAKLETRPQKNDLTVVETTTDGKTGVLTAIAPSGLPERLVFGASSTQSDS